MTSSDPRLAPAAAAPPEPQRPQVLASGHLHPAVLFLRFVEGVRRMALFLVLGILVNELFLLLALVPFVLQMIYGLASYLTVQYELTMEELVTREGILHRQERRIPVDRIQDLAFESTLLRRLFGLVVVRVETASGKAAEARLDSLGRPEAEQLREVLLRARIAAGAHAPAGEAAPAVAEERPIHRARPADLLLRGLTDLRAGAIVVAAFAALELADQLGLLGQLRGVFGSFLGWLGRLPPHLLFALLLALAIGVLAVGALVAVTGNVVRFWGFVLSLREDVLLRRYGLLTTRQKALPRRRIQRVTVEMTWLRRPFQLASVRADSASSGFTEAEDQKTGWDLVVPLARLPEAEALLPSLLPGLDVASTHWQRVSPRLVGRLCLEGALATAMLLVPALLLLGPAALALVLLVPLVWATAELVYRNFGWARMPGFLSLRRGILGRYLSWIPLRKVQSVILQAGPVDRLFGLATLTVHVAGGSPTSLHNLTRADAEALRAVVAAEAVAAASADWRPRVPTAAVPQ